jgi:hypothetical protein
VPPPSHLTFCTPTRSNLYLSSSLESVFMDRALCKLLTFHVPNLISIFHSLGRLSKESVQVRGSLEVFVTSCFLRWGVVNPKPNPPSWRATPCYLFVTAYSIYSQLTSIAGGRSLHPQPEDAPCCGDRDLT